MVEEGGGEELREPGVVPVPPGREVLLDDGNEERLVEELAAQPVEERREARDGGREEPASRLQHAAGLGEGGQAVGPLEEVVERAQQKQHVHARVGPIEGPGISDRRAGEPARRPVGRPLESLLDVQGHGVHEVHGVPSLGEPERVGPRRAAHVEHDAGRGREVAVQDVSGAGALQEVLVQPAALLAQRVVVQDLGWWLRG